jgi:hypothetical protein
MLVTHLPPTQLPPTPPLTPPPSPPPPRLQAFRDNHRVSLESPELAAQLWDATGLHKACSGLVLEDGSRPVGLNPNIRFYR